MLNSRAIESKVVSFDLSQRGLDAPQSKLDAGHNSRTVKSDRGPEKSFFDTATKHGYQCKGDGEMTGAFNKKKKSQSGSKVSSRFSALFRRH